MNVMMTGRRRCALALLLAALVLSGCGKKDAPDAPEQTAQTAAYSNLSDEASKELLSELFADAGIAAERADKFFACLDQFNGSVKAEWLTDGFETAAPTETKYDPYEMQEMWIERQGVFPGYICRSTAFELMGDRITAGEDQPDTNGEDWLFMDLETLKRDPDALSGKPTADICALIAPVAEAASADSTLQAEPLRKQAETAKKYLRLRDELKSAEVSVWMETLDRLHAQAETVNRDYQTAKENLAGAQRELEQLYAASENIAQ